jgi:carboxylate-amine ligase
MKEAVMGVSAVATGRVGATIGVEEEFHLVNPETGRLASGAERLLANVYPESALVGLAQQEFQRSMIETSTPICNDMDEVRASVMESRRTIIEAADRAGLGVVAAGTVPDSGGQRGAVFPDARYRRISQEYRQLAVEQQVCACQVQVGVPDQELAVRSVARLRGWLPAILALTAGSPYFQLTDTGYASYRNIVTARWPTGGPPPAFTGYGDYQRRIQNLIDAGVISDPGMIYYDVRPSHRYPTLEIRIADACPLVEDVVLVAALARALVVTAANAELRGDPPMVAHDEILRAATWKAARSGLTGQLVDPVAGQPVKAPELLRRLIVHLQDALEENGDLDFVRQGVDAVFRRGTSAERQRRMLTQGSGYEGVVAAVLKETRTGI